MIKHGIKCLMLYKNTLLSRVGFNLKALKQREGAADEF